MRMTWAAVAVGLATVVAWAADDKPKPQDKPADKLAALKKETEQAEQAMFKEYAKLGESKEDQKKAEELSAKYAEQMTKVHDGVFELAKADPKSETGFDALEWFVLRGQMYDKTHGEAVMRLLTEHYAASPKVGKMVLIFRYYRQPEGAEQGKPVEEFLAAVESKNQDKAVRGQMAMLKAWQAMDKYTAAEYRNEKNAEELATAAEKAFDGVVKEFGEVKLAGRDGKQTLADASKMELFELRNLRVGKTAPDIEGEDLDGTKFKLSDYKGKVVVIDFWGDW